MKKIRHTFKTILILALIVSLMLPTCVVSESATQRTQAEALAWIKARGDEAWWDDVDNAYGCQCVDLIMAYYSYLGVSRVGDNACGYITNTLPDGWYRDHTPTPGSIFVCPGNVWNGVWTDTTGFGHVGLVYSVSGNIKKTVETNTSGDGAKGLANAKWKDRNFDDSIVWYIHPFSDNANYIDVNIKIDGVQYDSGFDGITFDVYINGTKKNNNISDFCACYEIGTTYRIDDIQYDNSKYYYSGSSSYTGTVGTERSNIYLSFVSGTCKTKNAKKPTCTATGYTGDYGFEEKGGTFHVITKGTTISALGHDYQLKNYECKCETVSGEYVCSRCSSTKNEKDKEYIYSNWTTTKPTGVSGLETKTGYRFGTKEIKYSEKSTLSGYTPTGKTVTDFTNAKWSAWKLGTMAATNTRKVETKPLYRYYAWICPNCGNQDPISYHTASGDCTNCDGGGLYWGEVWSPIPYSESSYTAFPGTNKSYSTSLGDGKRWYFTTADVNKTAVGSIDSASDAIIIDNGYRYCDGVLKYEFYRGVNFSNWQDTPITETDSTVVETKTIYRYKIMPTGHTVGEWEITKNANCTTTGTKVKKCSVCHEVVETQTISKTDHTLGEWEVSIQATCSSIGKEVRRCTECKNVIEERDIEMKAHEYEETIVPATPTEQGYTLHECKNCPSSFKDNYVDYIEETNSKIVLENKSVIKGQEFTISVKIENNPGFGYLELTPVYPSQFTLVNVTNGSLISDLTKGNQLVWLNDEDVVDDGCLMMFTFVTDENVETGDYQVSFILRKCFDYGENAVSFGVIGGFIEIIDCVCGDATGDNVIDGLDIIRIKNYLSNFDYETETSTTEILPGADANGDGVIDGLDIIRLKKYIANYDYETGTSTVELGK